jgi:hypothetical protein
MLLSVAQIIWSIRYYPTMHSLLAEIWIWDLPNTKTKVPIYSYQMSKNFNVLF